MQALEEREAGSLQEKASLQRRQQVWAFANAALCLCQSSCSAHVRSFSPQSIEERETKLEQERTAVHIRELVCVVTWRREVVTLS